MSKSEGETMAKVVIREARPGDCALLAARMRSGDRREVEAMGMTPLEALRDSLAESLTASVLELDGVPVAMFGLVPDHLLSDRACAWLLTGEGIERIPVTFVRLSRQIIRKYLEQFSTLWNYVDARYTESVRWLDLCGAEWDGEATMGPERVPFRHFVIKRSDWNGVRSRCRNRNGDRGD